MRLKLVKFMCWLWDVIFTAIDLLQLKVWYKLVQYKEKIEYESAQDKRDFSNLEDWNAWEDIQ